MNINTIFHSDMRYLIRSIKYFFWFVCIFALIMLVLVIMGTAGGDISSMFRGGYSALWKIALIFAVIAAFYPKFGFARQVLASEEGIPPDRQLIREYMLSRGYIPEKDEAGLMTFRCKGTSARLSRMLEDRITFTQEADGMQVEGLRKDVVRIVSGIMHRMRTDME